MHLNKRGRPDAFYGLKSLAWLSEIECVITKVRSYLSSFGPISRKQYEKEV